MLANIIAIVDAYWEGMIKMCNNKHLTLQERLTIESELWRQSSFKKIASIIDKDCTTISKEVRKHISIKETGSKGKSVNNCTYRDVCTKKLICINSCIQEHQNRYCKYCRKCNKNCSEFIEEKCNKLNNPPYVCNGCKNYYNCRLTKHIYDGANSYKSYINSLKESRTGITINEKELETLNNILVPLIKEQGQSIHQAIINNEDKIMFSDKTIYKLVDLGLLKVRNIDLPRKVRYRERKKDNKNYYKVDKKCLENRRYEDFISFMEQNPDIPVVQMDTVEGIKGGKVLLTIHFVNCSFMLAYIRKSNDSQSVIDIFNNIQKILGIEKFKALFLIILTDNGSEFSNPTKIEFDPNTGEQRTRIFYCHPSSPFEKGSCEVNHELLRRILPKGESLDNLNQEDINLIMSHINSYKRKKLNNESPYSIFSKIYGKNTAQKLGMQKIEPNKVNLSKNLLKK